MLSYQHHYHAGNLADVHKHALLAWMLNYLTQKNKPLSYIETHAGRALYDLAAPEAVKTGEAAMGITRTAGWFAKDHPYRKSLESIQKNHGATAYPGSPLIAATLLRDDDTLHFAELHPGEFTALRDALWHYKGHTYQQDGFQLAQSLCPPEPRRGLLLIDPSYEVKTDYDTIPRVLQTLNRKWNVGILTLWYPILKSGAHLDMLAQLQQNHPTALRHEVTFPPIRDGHRMTGSGLFVINPPYGIERECKFLSDKFRRLT
ncbi:hypothetical protein P775_03695 [Puniceibacterium antarcticum]|uniref:Ribosomal RNA large subunit methyltransferase J n=1 Tax=Puniceibacterium antarcticum TaxID=1206336 RepID=A0A2G8RIZ9_9RHOB|nr:23S rRNA (adenine(2030)-N(6))-methyltransferase RlmJ [Puniceibacterium antarcticum]PIL21537.1 hypothetical protein P775_03695 [Puniceibacterium antarcticum]